MTKIAIFTEGQAESIFVRDLLLKVIDNARLQFECFRLQSDDLVTDLYWPVSELSTPKWKKVEASFSCGFCQLGLTYLFTVCL